ncbi:MAG: hypothetical protein M3Y22_08955, partial [Pseudomonadota bacterium]|nr:hypothetical protein [Pseudomonadota bacterium]
MNQTVSLPRWRKLASYARQFVTLNRCLGMWWRQDDFALNGTGHPEGMMERSPTPACSCRQPPDRCDNAPSYPEPLTPPITGSMQQRPTAINLVRVAEWFAGTPVARTRLSR